MGETSSPKCSPGWAYSPTSLALEATVGEEIRTIHRRVGRDDLYFVANALPEARRFLCRFRVAGRPELWWHDTGKMDPVLTYDERDGATLIPLALILMGQARSFFEEMKQHYQSL
ncbi:MAG: glycosyl hydrolase [Terriglobia bacterium]